MIDDQNQFVVIQTSCDSVEEARKISQILIDRRLIAAGQIIAKESIYWWEDEQYQKPEWELSCLSRIELYEQIEKIIQDNHSYQVAKVIAIPIVKISNQFADWLADNTSSEEQKSPGS
jgi:periplasmic divalent cation tolerance protein